MRSERAGSSMRGLARWARCRPGGTDDHAVEAKDGARARDVLERAEKSCIISAALKAHVTLAVHIDERHEAPSHGAA